MSRPMIRPHICLFEWSDDDGHIGSNHACGEERGHAGDHDCLTCHAQHPATDTEKRRPWQEVK